MRTFAVAILLAFVAVSFTAKRQLRELEDASHLRRGSPAPQLVLPQIDGVPIDVVAAARDKKIVLVTFWTTWCEPCLIELDELRSLYAEKGGAGLEIFAINEDEDQQQLTQFLSSHSLPFPVLRDPGGAAAQAYGVEAYPTSFLINAKGKIARAFDGFASGIERYLEDSD